METCKFTKLSNGNILLIINDDEYVMENLKNGDILLKKIITINITDPMGIKNHDFKKSTIIQCKINNIDITKLKYKTILEQIYKIIGDKTKIIRETGLNIKTIKKEDEGFYYIEKLGISIQGAESNKCLLEIANQCVKNNIEILLQIELLNKHIVNIKIN